MQNEMLLAMRAALVGPNADLEPAETAFEETRGDFAARFTAAVDALSARLAEPEVFIDIPEEPEQLTRAQLDVLVRPAADGFLRSQPSKGELLAQVARIKRRQEHRPAWIPRVDRDGAPLPGLARSADADGQVMPRPRLVGSFPELGEITVEVAGDYEDRPELAMEPGGVGELEAVLHTVLAVADDAAPNRARQIDAQANEALVPEELRWWPGESARPLEPTEDPGVASEVPATCSTLGGMEVEDGTAASVDAAVLALSSAGDWRHSRPLVLDSRDPGDDSRVLATARAALAAWADEGRSGLVMYFYGGAFHDHDGLIAVPSPLHSYVLCVTRSVTGQDAVDAVHRVTVSCPGEDWCRRGGCATDASASFLDGISLLAPVVTTGHAADVAIGHDEGCWEAYRRLYGGGDGVGYPATVIDTLEAVLSTVGWVELTRSEWEGGVEDCLLRRGEHSLTASYDPVTRQVRLVDGRAELEFLLDPLAEDGVLMEDRGQAIVDNDDEAVQHWGADLLAAAADLLGGRISALPYKGFPVQGALLGLHPHADGTLRGPASVTLVEEQLRAMLRAIGAIPAND